jgi:hypothetical protein
MEIDSRLEAHISLGLIMLNEWDWVIQVNNTGLGSN